MMHSIALSESSHFVECKQSSNNIHHRPQRGIIVIDDSDYVVVEVPSSPSVIHHSGATTIGNNLHHRNVAVEVREETEEYNLNDDDSYDYCDDDDNTTNVIFIRNSSNENDLTNAMITSSSSVEAGPNKYDNVTRLGEASLFDNIHLSMIEDDDDIDIDDIEFPSIATSTDQTIDNEINRTNEIEEQHFVESTLIQNCDTNEEKAPSSTAGKTNNSRCHIRDDNKELALSCDLDASPKDDTLGAIVVRTSLSTAAMNEVSGDIPDMLNLSNSKTETNRNVNDNDSEGCETKIEVLTTASVGNHSKIEIPTNKTSPHEVATTSLPTITCKVSTNSTITDDVDDPIQYNDTTDVQTDRKQTSTAIVSDDYDDNINEVMIVSSTSNNKTFDMQSNQIEVALFFRTKDGTDSEKNPTISTKGNDENGSSAWITTGSNKSSRRSNKKRRKQMKMAKKSSTNQL